MSTPMRRVALASCAGTTIEFYDFFIYGTAAALVFPKVFFPALGEAAGTVASFATFAVAFGARPLGAVLFGHFGDRLGRKRTLISTLLLMGIATVLIGCLPSAASIGVAAPILLVALRIAQGLAVGGEWAGATLLAAEYAPARKRGLYGVFPQLGPALAFALSSVTFLIVNLFVGEASPAFVEWGWRVPFLLSALLLAVGLYVRLAIDETPMFRKAVADPAAPRARAPIVGAFRHQWREILLAAGALAMLFAFFYIGTAFLTSYGTAKVGLSRSAVLAIGAASTIVFGAAIALSGVYSDRVGRKRVVLGACVVSVPWSLVMFPLLDTGSAVAFAVVLMVTMAVFGVAYGPAGALLPEMFRTRYRYSGAGIAYNLAGVVGGGTAPILAADLSAAHGGGAVGVMLAGFGLLSVVCTLALPETSAREMEDRPDGVLSAA
ncbi:MFS transporter [Actinokineospora sp. UTMC 2448]|uniref:MFS transporter n=1 Tax=Actinokineospora sp. UTMC 2448 TaxID=2268449 RepID=UPI00216498E5|nr:MFS transporter [Actinokineospora sp. UTMC 2448]UVS76855.1 Inner membrane metabolite transport protein YhjE [Actinokineospora sp. UTMC 2448]